MTATAPNLNRTIAIRVHKLNFLMDRLAEQTLREGTDLTFGQFRLLMALKRHGSLSQRSVAKFHGLTEAAVSRTIQDLVKRKLINRAVNPVSRREHLLGLTSNGEKALIKSQKVLDAAFTGLFNAVSLKDRQIVDQVLGELLQAIWDDGKRMYCGRPTTAHKR